MQQFDPISAKYRIAYEAFSKFSSKLGKTKTFDDLAKVVRKHVKYFFDYRIFRISMIRNGKPTIFTFHGNDFKIEKFKKNIMAYEWDLLKSQQPFLKDEFEHKFEDIIAFDKLKSPKLWGWYQGYEDIDVTISLLTDDVKKFSRADMEILHLLIESFVIKYQQIYLQFELADKNKRLQRAVKEIENKNQRIEEIIEDQLKIIEQRTKEIKRKNEKLMEFSTLNAHNLREPLTRIMGLMNLAETIDEIEFKTEILERMKISVKDMDQTLREIIIKTEKEMTEYSIFNA